MMDLIDRNQLLKENEYIYDSQGNILGQCNFIKMENFKNAPTVKAYTVDELIEYFKEYEDDIINETWCFDDYEKFYEEGKLDVLETLIDDLTECGRLR